MTGININTERIDDIPLLFSFLQQMGIQETPDAYALSRATCEAIARAQR
jgi:hypothetical protein